MKPELHQSRLKFHLTCPKAFALAGEHKADIGAGTLNVMREGELFEGYTLGFKEDKDEAAIIGRKKPATIDGIKEQAKYAKNIFVSGESYVKLRHEKEGYVMAGEADHIGQLDWDWLHSQTGIYLQSEGKTINDLKYTGDISRVWFGKTRADYLQAIYYIAMHFFETGELLPFVYIVCEGKYSKPVIRVVKVIANEDSIENWLMPKVEAAANDLFFDAAPSFENCLGGKGGSRCWFLDHCKEGRVVAGGVELVDFTLNLSDLQNT